MDLRELCAKCDEMTNNYNEVDEDSDCYLTSVFFDLGKKISFKPKTITEALESDPDYTNNPLSKMFGSMYISPLLSIPDYSYYNDYVSNYDINYDTQILTQYIDFYSEKPIYLNMETKFLFLQYRLVVANKLKELFGDVDVTTSYGTVFTRGSAKIYNYNTLSDLHDALKYLKLKAEIRFNILSNRV
jgi:hypothetical protein